MIKYSRSKDIHHRRNKSTKYYLSNSRGSISCIEVRWRVIRMYITIPLLRMQLPLPRALKQLSSSDCLENCILNIHPYSCSTILLEETVWRSKEAWLLMCLEKKIRETSTHKVRVRNDTNPMSLYIPALPVKVNLTKGMFPSGLRGGLSRRSYLHHRVSFSTYIL